MTVLLTSKKGAKMERIRDLLKNEKVQGVIAITAAIIMYFTPDHIDAIIEMCLAALGIGKLTLVKKE